MADRHSLAWAPPARQGVSPLLGGAKGWALHQIGAAAEGASSCGKSQEDRALLCIGGGGSAAGKALGRGSERYALSHVGAAG